MPTRPELSFIVPTRNRADYLPLVLDGFRRQSLVPSHFEIVVVDDGSTDETQAVLDSFADLPLRVFRQNHAGIGAAKNLGVFASRGDIIVFADDDDIPDPHLAAAHLMAHRFRPDPAVAILGHTELAPGIRAKPVMRNVTEVSFRLFCYPEIGDGPLGYQFFWGGRSSCKRSLLLTHGVFDPAFVFGCEDVELGYRLARGAGLTVYYEPTALTTMIRALSFRDFCGRQMRQGRAQRIFASRHPAREVQRYCEVEIGTGRWQKYGPRYAQYLRWAERLDHIANVYADAGYAIGKHFERLLDGAYADLFALSRAKGVAWNDA